MEAMSDQTGPSADAAPPTAEIMQNLQALTDIEGDLADTAIAVAAAGNTGAEADQTTSGSAHPSTAAVDAESTLMRSAEQMETTLEHLIPAAPVHAAGAQDSAAETKENAAAPVASTTTAATNAVPPEPVIAQTSITLPSDGHRIDVTTPGSSSLAAHDARAALEAVEADVMNPVLPDSVAPPAHDVVAETKAEEETSPIKVDIMPTIPEASPMPVTGSVQAAASSAAGPSTQAARGQTAAADIAMGASSGVSAIEEQPLPGGLSASSPSVLSNPDLIRAWSRGVSNDKKRYSLQIGV